MDVAVRIIAALVIAYLIGGTPFALIVGKLGYRKDLREYGSGNLGATNVYRILGWKAALLVAVLDVTKGSLAVGLAAWAYGVPAGDPAHDWMLIGSLIAAMLGHSYSPYIRFSGGKGVATAAGGLLIITPLALAILVASFFLIGLTTRWVSLGSVIVAIEFPLLCLLFYGDRKPIVIMSFLASALVIWRHRGNIARMFRGEEPRFTFTRSDQETNGE